MPERSPAKRIRVLVIDDLAVMRRAIVELLEREPTIEVAGQAEDAVDALIQFKHLHPDVVLLDLGMPGLSGLQAIPMMRNEYPAVKVLVLSMLPETFYRPLALRAGADAFVPKHEMGETLSEVIRRVLGTATSKRSEPDPDPA